MYVNRDDIFKYFAASKSNKATKAEVVRVLKTCTINNLWRENKKKKN